MLHASMCVCLTRVSRVYVCVWLRPAARWRWPRWPRAIRRPATGPNCRRAEPEPHSPGRTATETDRQRDKRGRPCSLSPCLASDARRQPCHAIILARRTSPIACIRPSTHPPPWRPTARPRPLPLCDLFLPCPLSSKVLHIHATSEPAPVQSDDSPHHDPGLRPAPLCDLLHP
jgi:hypothetical protein